ncbi:pyocin knob domain-containing protein [Paenibacillus thiaminolyticus]|uniref:pyocin knob domain-containing protein n=1 Tax=Paenibacillus thiaminolyticus TaxID=49283 RepID=UPI0025438179|nr:pyocin knob domain-containing protein [Paenibacillus thiaminolyticus]WII36907.1 pyocin knob domain-containing protein [Paenibacillus thiaminolyticus]
MAFQKPLPEWKQPGIRPPESKIKEGYQVLDKPPAAWLNWQMNTTYEALQELQEKAAEKEDVSEALGEAKAYTDEKVADIDLTNISPESIGAAKQADLDAHAADAVKHITVAERAAWNQAENNAKSYIDAKPWQRHKVSGDDGAAIDITNRDLNSIVHTGFYRGTNLGNAPALLHGWGYVEVITHAPGSWVLQKVYDLHADRFYMRRLTDSGWTAWTQDLFQSGVDAKTRIAGAISAKGISASANDTFEQLVTKIGEIRTDIKFASGNANYVEKLEVTNLDFEPLIVCVNLIAQVRNNNNGYDNYDYTLRGGSCFSRTFSVGSFREIKASFYHDRVYGSEDLSLSVGGYQWLPNGFSISSISFRRSHWEVTPDGLVGVNKSVSSWAAFGV